MAAGGGWWALGLDSLLARIDLATASVEQRIRVAANTLSAIAVGAGAVWAAAPYDGTVWRIDPDPRLIQRTIDLGAGVTDVAYVHGSVWALNSLRGTVSRIDPETNRVAATTPEMSEAIAYVLASWASAPDVWASATSRATTRRRKPGSSTRPVRRQRQPVRADQRGDRGDRPVQLGLRVRPDPDRRR